MSNLSHNNLKKLQVDVTDDASVKAAVAQIFETDGHDIDILVLNAGLACTSTQTVCPFIYYTHSDSIQQLHCLMSLSKLPRKS